MVDPTAYPNGIRFTMPMKFRPDTELIEAVCENNTASLARMAKTAPAEVVDVPAATLSGHVGVYDLVDADGNKTVAAITVDGSTLALDYDGKGKEALLPLSPTRFSWSGTIVEFAAGAGGAPEMVIHYAEGSRDADRAGNVAAGLQTRPCAAVYRASRWLLKNCHITPVVSTSVFVQVWPSPSMRIMRTSASPQPS